MSIGDRITTVKKKPSVDELIEQIHNASGNVSAIARAYKVARSTVYAWIKDSVNATQALSDERETLVDMAESALRRNVLEGSSSDIFYTLNNSPEAKRRGWGPRHEITGAEGGPVVIVNWESNGNSDQD